MSYRELLRSVREQTHLFSCLFELTYACNWDCFFCYNDTSKKGQILRITDYRVILGDLVPLQCLMLTFSGGEPLSHPDFFEIGALAKQLGFVVRIKSNGYTLRGEKLRRMVEEIEPQLIELSLHGACAATHDRQTRVAGSFVRLLENIEGMKAAGLRLQLNSTLTLWNEAELEPMFLLADRIGVPLRFDPEVSPKDDGDQQPLQIAPSNEGIARLYQLQRTRAEELIQLQVAAPFMKKKSETAKDTAKKYCGAGTSSVVIDPFGYVLPCVQFRHAIGNLKKQSMLEIWMQQNKELDFVRQQNEAAKRFVLESDKPMPGYCPGNAYHQSGAVEKSYQGLEKRLKVLSS